MQSTSSIASSSFKQCVPLVSFRSNLLVSYIPSRNSSAISSRAGLSNPRTKGLASLQVQLILYSATPISPGQVRGCLFHTVCTNRPTIPVLSCISAFEYVLIGFLSTVYQPSLIVYLAYVGYVLPGCMAAVLRYLSIQQSFLRRPVL
jgi:hypothetical protein